nr:uncharacterized protein LOC109158392 [Ipomoea batatas]
MRVNRTYPTIVGWSAELARKRVKEENKAGSFGRGTVLPRISKPTDIAAATSRQNDQPPVAALNIPSSSVDKVAWILQKLASTVGEFGEAMAEIGKQGAPVNVMRKTFSGLSNMLNVASTIEATATPTSSQLDDIFFGSESFTTAVDALIFFPVLPHGHYFLICINVKASKLEIIDNKSLVRGVTMKDKYGDCTTLLVTALKEYLALGSSALFWKVDELTEEVVDMSWKESENYIDCGLFVMRHMETYKGTLKKWNSGFKKKARLNKDFLIGLRASGSSPTATFAGNREDDHRYAPTTTIAVTTVPRRSATASPWRRTREAREVEMRPATEGHGCWEKTLPVNRRIEPRRYCPVRRRSFQLLFTARERGRERSLTERSSHRRCQLRLRHSLRCPALRRKGRTERMTP